MNAPASPEQHSLLERSERQAQVVRALQAVLPAHALLRNAEDTTPYECDGLTAYRQRPLVVALPETYGQVQAVLKATPPAKPQAKPVEPAPVKAESGEWTDVLASLSREQKRSLYSALGADLKRQAQAERGDEAPAVKAHVKAKAQEAAKVKAAAPSRPYMVQKPNGAMTHSRFATPAEADAWLRTWCKPAALGGYKIVVAA